MRTACHRRLTPTELGTVSFLRKKHTAMFAASSVDTEHGTRIARNAKMTQKHAMRRSAETCSRVAHLP